MRRYACSLHQHLRHVIRVFLVYVAIVIFVGGTPQFSGKYDFYDDTIEVPDKRPARLSYFRTPYVNGYSRGRYSMPWTNLPNINCLRKHCESDSDCCRRYSKCNEEAQVCYDCWYGYPCRTNKDCCDRYPTCNLVLNSCGK